MDACLQLHGDAGGMYEYPIARAWRAARVSYIYGGTDEIMKEVIGRKLQAGRTGMAEPLRNAAVTSGSAARFTRQQPSLTPQHTLPRRRPGSSFHEPNND